MGFRDRGAVRKLSAAPGTSSTTPRSAHMRAGYADAGPLGYVQVACNENDDSAHIEDGAVGVPTAPYPFTPFGLTVDHGSDELGGEVGDALEYG